VIPRVSTATGKKKEEVDNGPLFQRNNLKHQRDIDEHKLKVKLFILLFIYIHCILKVFIKTKFYKYTYIYIPII